MFFSFLKLDLRPTLWDDISKVSENLKPDNTQEMSRKINAIIRIIE